MVLLPVLPALLVPLLVGRESATPPASAPNQGNVLILVADDLGIDQLGLYGVVSDPAPTPNLERMAAAGVLFRNVWSQPTCSPTRATLQTGRYGFRTGIGAVINAFTNGPALPLAEVTLPEMLDLGTGGRYAHAAIGKWHLGTGQTGGDLAPNLAGYGHFAGSMEGQLGTYFDWRRVEDGVVTRARRYATTVCVNDALAWIRHQGGPWVCVVSFQAPHAPFHRPPSRLHSQVLPPGEPPASCTAPGPDARPFYKAAVEALDREIGRLLTHLPAGELVNTTVFFLGDNGSESCVTLPSCSGQAKATLYEGGVRVPLLVAGRGVSGRGECQALVNTTDLFATVAELAGVDLAATLPGVELDSVSFAPCLADPSRRVRAWIYADSFARNGPGNPQLPPPCPSADVCQASLGFGGPGGATLASCGRPLYGVSGEHVVPWRLTGARPLAQAWLLIGSSAPAFLPQLGAWIVPAAPDFVGSYVVGPSGTLDGATWTGDTSRESHYQFVVLDPRQARGYSVSNALRMELLPSFARAVRERRYKLIRFDPCRAELYDLELDPFERTNLLTRPLSAQELAAHDRLARRLELLRP